MSQAVKPPPLQRKRMDLDAPETLYSPRIIKLVKLEMSRIWERVKATKGLTQAQLAAALSTSQSAVSKLLKTDDTHPWTANYILIFCEFCNVNLEEEILKQLPKQIAHSFANLDEGIAETDDRFHEECTEAVARYFRDKGIKPKPDQLSKLAARLVSRVKRNASADDIQKGLENVILEAALSS
ncbi:helix-turn-helix transcriptional regulator [Bradyrhizobium sp. STM 3809]|uniref:helix-turn-helix domain-containing protein n=1 Tax=Bradyrhizobium sp. STM 3809 TaxID=551936 RepID=UPI00111277A1|nr:helix-turn-helix transcriptional regulator [Bradyrhizobium sp. STM 3809]